METLSLPNPLLIGVHHQFAPATAWLEVFDHMKQSSSVSRSSTLQGRSSLAGKKTWIRRYYLASLGKHIYGGTGSDVMHRLPLNLYLRKAHQNWAPRHQAELRALQIYRGSSYILMTGLHGCGIGQRLATMTDIQLDAAAQDLKGYLAELRSIPNTINSPFCICNPLGGGILDWRIGDSQRQQLRFRTETEFSQFLTNDLPFDEDARRQISKAHSVKHDIVFTHADLNLRNILVDEMGRISGIVDWECAGWYPEHWEYTKMHFTMRVTARWIADVVDQIFPGYRDELVVEDMLAAMAPSW
ncbi:hypothetical protein HBI13_149890 [Parastagonospora nodorum]|nr:hypothetical protein HBH51_074010 [Parastagonospora nodorum]KAH4007532.1 hypothetical protein HBI10_001880 [Parastagonospora nodorum]KAH4016564.1 hypothetical protein HBI13_149890 [Parastagonospora nodorum]KAH6370106.1 hypothetical protein HBI36_022820 [Parastagonospora nodorum]